MSRIYLIALCCLCFFASCNYFTDDIYYTNKGAMNYTRIPLLKPYHVMKTDGDWDLKFNYEYMIDGNSFKVDALNVLDTVIILYHNPEAKTTSDSLAAWALIVPGDSTEVRFTNLQEFTDSLSYFTAKPPVFIPVATVWNQFEKTGSLEWFPKEYRK